MKIKTSTQTKVRDKSLDMTKGLLIAFLIIHHIIVYASQGRTSEDVNGVIRVLNNIQPMLFSCYFMPAFFLISGMCSNFQKDFKPFIVNQIKYLLIPAISFILLFHIYFGEPPRTLCGDIVRLFIEGKDYWFLIALFGAKIIFYGINKLFVNKNIIVGVLLTLSALGVLLNDLNAMPNYFMHRQIFDLTVFLGIGHLFKDSIRKRKTIQIAVGLYVFCGVGLILLNIPFPVVTYGFATTITTWPVHMVLSVTGTIIIIFLGKIMPIEPLIEYMGKNSLAIFLIQWYTLEMFMNAFNPMLDQSNVVTSTMYICSVFVATIAIGLFVAYITNNTKLRVLMGKF